MLESCQKNHMFLGLGVLVLITIIVLIFESRITDDDQSGHPQPYLIENNSTCWLREDYEVTKECHPCTPNLGEGLQATGVCVNTRFQEILRCKSGEIVIKSCDRVAIDNIKHFFVFESFCFIGALISFLVAYIRERLLNRRIHLKIDRQINRVN